MENPQSNSDDPASHRCYNLVLKMVLWDEPKAKIDQKMEVNKVPPELARKIYDIARSERLRTIRGEALKKILLGVLLLVIAGGIVATFWFGFGFILRLVWISCSLIAAFGIWKFVDGITAFFMAGKVRGSVADEIS